MGARLPVVPTRRQREGASCVGGGRATAGLLWDRFEVFGGWQATWIGDVTLDGPTAGVRLWF
jgi:hypothetical protein